MIGRGDPPAVLTPRDAAAMTAESLLAASSFAEYVFGAGAIVLGTILVAKALLRPAARPATLERWAASLTGSR